VSGKKWCPELPTFTLYNSSYHVNREIFPEP
jgi:hypothetical protein